jgi:hypothetical protein
MPDCHCHNGFPIERIPQANSNKTGQLAGADRTVATGLSSESRRYKPETPDVSRGTPRQRLGLIGDEGPRAVWL